MSNYNSLKGTINANIKANGNKEITGSVLNSVLNAMVNTLGAGYKYAGVATPSSNPGTPDTNVFYIAATAGTYTNMGGLVVADGEVAILKYNGTWTKDVTGIASADQVAKIGDVVENLSIQAKQLGDVISQTLPSEDYIDGSFSVGAGNDGRIFFDPLQFVEEGGTVDSVSIRGTASQTSGKCRIYRIRFSDKTPVDYQEFDLTTGLNVLNPTFPAAEEKMYIGIWAETGAKWYWRQSASASVLPSYAMNVDGSSLTQIGYYLGYSITTKTINPVLSNRVSTLETKVGEIESQVGSVQDVILPNASWIDGSFPTGGGGGNTDWIFFDTRCIVSAQRKLTRIHANIRNGGTVRVYLFTLSGEIVTYKDITTSQGWNDIPITFDDQYYTQQMYVGLSTGSGIYIYLRSNASTSTSFRRVISTSTNVAITYDIGYAIEVADTSNLLVNRVDAITVSPEDTLEDILSKGQDDIVLGPYDYQVPSPIVLNAGQTIRGSFGKTRLILTNGCTTAISASNVENIKISDLEIVGTCPDYAYQMNGIIAGSGYDLVETEEDAIALNYMGAEKGIYLYHCENVVLENIKINHITGSAIHVDYVGRNYIKGLNACNLFITNCYNGIYCVNEHEFSQYTNFTITLCMIGLYVASGNLVFTAGHMTRCRVAMMYVGGTNNAHGLVNGVELKHNQVAGLLCSGVTNGEFFQGLYVSYCSIISRDCTGLYFSTIVAGSAPIDFTGTGGKNRIENLVKRGAGVNVVNSEGLTVQNTVILY